MAKIIPKPKGGRMAKYTVIKDQTGKVYVNNHTTSGQKEFETLDDFKVWASEEGYEREWLAIQLDCEEHMKGDTNLINPPVDKTATLTLKTSTVEEIE